MSETPKTYRPGHYDEFNFENNYEDQGLPIKSRRQLFAIDGTTYEGTVGVAKNNGKILGPIPTESTEQVIITAGELDYRLEGETEWRRYQAGQTINIPANVKFEWSLISDQINYQCIFIDKPVNLQEGEEKITGLVITIRQKIGF